MINVVLVCQYGASTGMVAEKIKQAAKKRNIEMVVNAYGITEIDEVIDSADIVLLGPQMRFHNAKMKEKYKDKDVLITDIAPLHYGMMDGEKILEMILVELDKFREEKESL